MADMPRTTQMNYILYGDRTAKYRVLLPVNGRENAAEIFALLPEADVCLIAVRISDWFTELSPWRSDIVMHGASFAGDGRKTLLHLEKILSELQVGDDGGHAVILAGYSLAGLFALWASYETALFSGVAAVSPSLWFPGWTAYAAERTPRTSAVYLSLGDREEKTGNPVMAGVGNALREQYRLLQEQNIPCSLEWSAGGHFRDAEARTAKGILRVIELLKA